MDNSSSYKNYLPSKKIQIVIAVIVAAFALWIIIPRVIVAIKKHNAAPAPAKSLGIAAPTGDPTTRDSDKDGVSDWQEIAVGLNPHKSETSAGTPDAKTFDAIKNRIGLDIFAQAESESTTTDKISLTVSHDIEQAGAVTGAPISQTLSEATVNEILNYIDSQKKSYIVYASKDLTVIANTLANNQTYASKMAVILKDDPKSKNTAADIKAYASGTGSKEKFAAAQANMSTAIGQLKSVSVPSAAVTSHLDILNALQGLYQTTQNVDPAAADEIVRFGSLSLLQDYAIKLSTAVGKFSIYLSIALNKNGYVK